MKLRQRARRRMLRPILPQPLHLRGRCIATRPRIAPANIAASSDGACADQYRVFSSKCFLVPRRIGKKCEKRVKNGIRLKKISAFRPNYPFARVTSGHLTVVGLSNKRP
jgi:hypothetical protein